MEEVNRLANADVVQVDRDHMGNRRLVYEGKRYTDTGFLLLDVGLKGLKTQDIRPTLEELRRFQVGTRDEDVHMSEGLLSLQHIRPGAKVSHLTNY